MFYKHVVDGHIAYISRDMGNTVITEEEYAQIQGVIDAGHEPAPEGHGVRLRTDLTWETYALPDDPVETEATEEDYQAALCEMGVDLSDEREA